MLYRIKYSADPKVIGHAEVQIESIVEHAEPGFFHSSSDIPRYGEISYDLKLPPFQLKSAAKKTDLLQHVPFSGKLLLLSPKAKTIISGLFVDNGQWYPSTVHQLQRKLNYYALYLPQLRQEFIDWKASVFSIVYTNKHSYDGGVMRPIELKEVKLDSHEAYLGALRSLRGTPQTVNGKKIQFVSPIEYDLFKIATPARGHYCSARFKEKIEEHSLTGFDFEPVN